MEWLAEPMGSTGLGSFGPPTMDWAAKKQGGPWSMDRFLSAQPSPFGALVSIHILTRTHYENVPMQLKIKDTPDHLYKH